MREINKIIIHHSASPVKTTYEEIDKWHKARGWDGIGYHYIINDKGLYIGRDIKKVGAHCLGENKNSIGICLTGNFNLYKPTGLQMYYLGGLVLILFQKYGELPIYGHKEFNNKKDCPGKYLSKILAALKAETEAL